MAELPALFVPLRDISSINAGTSVCAKSFTENGVVCRDLYAEYIPARRCRTCRYWVDCGHHFDCVAWNGCSECPPDGSGFCHNYEGIV